MIFYFSSTGNSKWAARLLAEQTCDNVLSIADELRNGSCEYALKAGEKVGFVFPVHGWRVPTIVRDFISKVQFKKYHEQTYTYALATCGDSAGETMQLLEGHLKNAGMHLNASFTVIMPESYIGLPFMYLDTYLKAGEKCSLSRMRINKYAALINDGRAGEHLDKGALPKFYSSVLGGFFYGKLITDIHFHVDKDKCVHCGKCENVCPVDDITCKGNGMPEWQHNNRCMTCFSCLHHCPENAISWGWFTKGKGQYLNSQK